MAVPSFVRCKFFGVDRRRLQPVVCHRATKRNQKRLLENLKSFLLLHRQDSAAKFDCLHCRTDDWREKLGTFHQD
ncbi:hypothetical protein [Nostoc sp. DSM 114160]